MAEPEPQTGTPESPAGRRISRSHLAMTVGGVAGLALGLALLIHSGLKDVIHILGLAGWSLLWVIPVHAAPIAVDALAWRILLYGHPRAGMPFLVWTASVRDSINTLLPVARVGGEVAGVRLLMLRGVPGVTSAASVIVEVTLTLVVQFGFTLLGLMILLYYLQNNEGARIVIIGLLVSLPVLVIFFLLQQRWGLFQLLERALIALTGRQVLSLAGDMAHLDAAIQQLYRQRRLMLVGCFWQFAGLMVGAVEVWFTMWLLGHPIDLLDAIMLESLAQAVQSASFMIPGNLGVQEGSFVLFGAAAGLTPDVSLALSLARRVRQVGYGIPFLLSWQWVEGRHLHRLLRRSKDDSPHGNGGNTT